MIEQPWEMYWFLMKKVENCRGISLNDVSKRRRDGSQKAVVKKVDRLGHAQVHQFLKFCLKTYFIFDGTIYGQVKGTPMGSPISGFIAEVVRQRLESLVFRTPETEVLGPVSKGDNRVSRDLLESCFTGLQSTNKCNDLTLPYSVQKLLLGGLSSHAGNAKADTVRKRPTTAIAVSTTAPVPTSTSAPTLTSAASCAALPSATTTSITSATTSTSTMNTTTSTATDQNAPDAPTITNTFAIIPIFRDTDSVQTCPHCDHTLDLRIGLVGNLRFHRTETGKPVPGAPTHIR
ncbi:hypothetical protein SprV_0401472300 [Sparganum proliferum]